MTDVTDLCADALLVVAGLVHLLPGLAASSPARAARAYGVRVEGPELTVLLRHRGVLLVLVGLGLLVAPWWSAAEPVVVTAGLASTGSFVLLAASARDLAPVLRRVQWIDVGLVVLVVAAVVLRQA